MDKEGIVIIPSWYPSRKDPIAGIFIQQQAKALRAAGVNINIFFVEEILSLRYFWDQKVSYRLEQGIPTYRVKAFLPPKRIACLRPLWIRQWRRLMEAYIKKNQKMPVILHAHSFVGGAAALKLSLRYKIPYLMTEHHGGVSTGEIPKYWETELTKIYRSAEKVIAVSSTLKETITKYGAEVELLPNMIDTALFFPGPLKARSDAFRIVNVGGLDYEKDATPLIQALPKLDRPENVELYLIGEGPLKSKLKKKLRKLGLEHQVFFEGRKSPKDLANLLKQADLFVSTSKLESFGMALVEAMACGLPVISFRKGIATEIIDEENGRLVDSETELVEAITFFKDQTVGGKPDRSFQLVKDRFGREKIAKELRGIYCKIIR